MQAVGRHTFADPLLTPGEVDLTAHVDFQALAQAAEGMGARVHGPVAARRVPAPARHRAARGRAQGERAAATRPPTIEAALTRLTDEDRTGMGRLFKAIALVRPEARRAARLRRVSDREDLSACRTKPACESRDTERRMLQASALAALAGIRHAFFTRDGGVSDGIYASLNGGLGSDDAPANVAENRARMAATLGVRPDRLLTAYQIHSPDVVTVERPWTRERAAARRRHRDPDARPRHRRHHRRLRPGAVRRRGRPASSAPPMPAGAAR